MPSPLTLTRGVTCLEQRALAESLEDALDRRLESTGLRVQVQGSTHDPRTAVIRLYALSGQTPALAADEATPLAERWFRPGPPRCADFQRAVALAITMMINNAEREQPVQVEQTVRSDPSAPPLPAVPPSSAHTTQEIARQPAVVPERPRSVPLLIAPLPRADDGALRRSSERSTRQYDASYWRAQAAFAVGLQVGPPRTRGLSAGLVYARSRLEFELGVLSLFSTDNVLRDTALHYRTRPLAARVGLALPLIASAWASLRLALSVLAGRMRTDIETAARDTRDTQSVRWFAGGASLELGLPLRASLQLTVSAGLLCSVRQLGVRATRDDVVLGSEVFKPVGALFGVGVGYQRPLSAAGQGSGVERHP